VKTKADHINEAFEELRISGITVTQGATGNVLGLARLESMMAQFYEAANLDVGYNFEENPNLNTPSGVTPGHDLMVAQNLAVELCLAYGKDPDNAGLRRQADGAYQASLAIAARYNTRQVQPSFRMPRGRGNEFRFPVWNRYMRPPVLPPTVPGVENIIAGETEQYTLDVSAWLGNNTISSIALLNDPRLTIDASSYDGGTISYTVTAANDTSDGPWQLIQITVTDSAGRVNIWLISFEVLNAPEVG